MSPWTDSGPDESLLSLAEQLFGSFLAEQAAGMGGTLEDLCGRHPDLAEDLRRLDARQREAERICRDLKQASCLADLEGRVPRAPQSTIPADTLAASWKAFVSRLSERQSGKPRYRLLGEVGQGGMGVVLEVWDDELGRKLAMKVALSEVPDQAEATPLEAAESLGRFVDEAQVTGQLDHPGIVPVHELGLDADRRVYFTMRLVRGRNLREVIDLARRGEEDWNQARVLGVLLKVCEAMAYAHSKGVIHRDLKPGNIMVGRFGEVYVMDWGLAKVIGEQQHGDPLSPAGGSSYRGVSPSRTAAGLVLGTPSYMPPEQARGEIAHIDQRSDVYSIGAMLYHALSSRMPYVREGEEVDSAEVVRRVIAGPPESLHSLRAGASPELEAICEKAMARDPAQRYASTETLARDLRAYLEQRVVLAYEAGPLAELRKWVKRNRGTAASLGAAVTLTLVFLVILNVTTQRSQRRIEKQNVQLGEAYRDVAAAKERAERNYEDFNRLADLNVLRGLEEESRELWPAWPEQIPRMEAWLRRAERVAQSLPLHESYLARLSEEDRAVAPSLPRSVDADRREAWLPALVRGLVEDLRGFVAAGPRPGLVAEMRQRLERARSIERRSIEEHVEAWEEAITEIELGDVYGRDGKPLMLSPQMGLVPLGDDPNSGLWEFWVVESGERPERDPGSGELSMTPESGLVLVLLPGGCFQMGCQRSDARAPCYDPNALLSDELHTVELDPFFLSKYEMTQGQWLRIMGSNPSLLPHEKPLREQPESLLLPVEQVSYTDCVECLRRIGLTLPTEAQWEYGARAGTPTAWWCGNTEASIGESHAGNLHDQTSYAARAAGSWGPPLPWTDGHADTAPVASFAANPFGLHDVIGNVLEWCRDWSADYRQPVSTGDGLREPEPEGRRLRIYRGGSFDFRADVARSHVRDRNTADTANFNLGLRPARPLMQQR
ncbi:MAG: bifunctional serine/threonine-protein kinase/formylglycine-generating enzyme family protein [Planctomycetota bacterium]